MRSNVLLYSAFDGMDSDRLTASMRCSLSLEINAGIPCSHMLP